MLPYLLVSRSAEYETRLRALLGERLAVIPGEFLTFGPDAVVSRTNGQPRVALLGPVLNYEETKGLVEALAVKHPDLGLIVVREQRSDLEDWVDELSLHAVLSPDASDDTTLALLDRLSAWLVANGRAESHDFDAPLALEVDDMPFVDLVDESAGVEDVAAEPAAAPEPEPAVPEWEFPPLEAGTPSEAIAVVAPKGGQGKTTIAINLATGLAEVAPNSVVLVDADLQFGDITAALALAPTRTIVDAVADVAADEIVLKTTLTHHEDGFFVIASAPSPELGDQVAPLALARLIERLRATFRYVIVDTTPGLGEHTLVALEHVTDAVFVTNMGVPSLRAMRTEFELLTRLGLMPGNRHLVVNQTDKNSGLTIKDVEHIIGAPVDVEVPKSSAVLLASNRGVPLIHDDVRDPAAKAIRSIVLRIAPEAFPKRSKIQRRRRTSEPE
ncbi:MinD-like ATPase involved in chromosome partitioning or flagellar assembly [Agromyces cerinus]|uniref:AAA family ATPase n=1 Tax=Agromyces cerinus TaxID=33878 RepID=UPI001EF7F710|nr:AAA family ATPase [Agromyces cerinus]MBM7831988.1 MinD-like ATPase involved in chromosome partitioning or flagellar assembly [Agromyces cerinus]